MIKKLFRKYSQSVRKKRSFLFTSLMKLTDEQKIIDLGGGNGVHFASCFPYRKNVTIADIDKKDLEYARKEFGFNTMVLDESGILNIKDKDYDVVFCNSVIEHVTVDKSAMYQIKTNKEFSEISFNRQRVFANEIDRIGKKYFVQTPYKYFPVESHSWLPVIIVLLPRKAQIAVLKLFNKFWAKKTHPDWHLLTVKKMKKLFPNAKIIKEKSFGFTKSLIAYKNDN
ncbi:MAG: class I SAM-dependent methyltransferase [Chitinophagales bacterium]